MPLGCRVAIMGYLLISFYISCAAPNPTGGILQPCPTLPTCLPILASKTK